MVFFLLTLLALPMPVSSIAVLCLEMVWSHVNIAPSHDTTQLLPQYAQYAQYDSDPLRDRTGPGGSKMENTSGVEGNGLELLQVTDVF